MFQWLRCCWCYCHRQRRKRKKTDHLLNGFEKKNALVLLLVSVFFFVLFHIIIILSISRMDCHNQGGNLSIDKHGRKHTYRHQLFIWTLFNQFVYPVKKTNYQKTKQNTVLHLQQSLYLFIYLVRPSTNSMHSSALCIHRQICAYLRLRKRARHLIAGFNFFPFLSLVFFPFLVKQNR
jgi:hypothetical protein